MSASRGGAFCGSLQNTTGGGAIKEGLNAKNRLLMCAQFPNKHTNMVVRERDQRRSVLRQPALDSRAKLGPRAAATPGHRERDAVHLPRGIFELEDELGGVGREQGAGPLRLWGLTQGGAVCKQKLALIWYRALTWYSSPARSLAAPDDPRPVTGQ